MSEFTMHLQTSAGKTITFAQVGAMLASFSKKNAIMMRLLLKKGAEDIKEDIIASMTNSPASGRRYKRGGKIHIASSPGNPPRPDTYRLIKSITTRVIGNSIEVGSTIKNPLYPKYLEKGTHKMAPRPWLEPAVKKWTPIIQANGITMIKQSVDNFSIGWRGFG